jgi:hypothetical protein
MNQYCDRRKSRAARALLIHKTLPILLHHQQIYQQQNEGMTESLPGSSSGSTSIRDTATTSTTSGARSIPKQQQQQQLDDVSSPFSTSNTVVSPRDLQRYRDSLMLLMTHPDTCILNPDRDVFWDEELHYTTVKPSKVKQPKTLASTIAAAGDGIVHKCFLCGKTFYSRYYLDRHMENMHTTSHGGDNYNWGQSLVVGDNHHFDSTMAICPANEHCRLLGGKLCDRQALQDEPYYAPGIMNHDYHGNNLFAFARSRDTTTTTTTTTTTRSDHPKPLHYYTQPSSPIQVQRNYQRLIHSQPCNPLDMEQSREFCRISIQECFLQGGKDDFLARDMIAILCDTHTCPIHLQMLHSNLPSVHVFKQEWDFYQNEMEHWGWGFVLLVVAGLGYTIWNAAPYFPLSTTTTRRKSRGRNFKHWQAKKEKRI